MSYEIFKITQGPEAGACVLVGKGPHDGTLRHVPPYVLEEIVGSAREKARKHGFAVKRESLLREPENKDGPEVLRYVAERFDRMFEQAHHERVSRTTVKLSRTP